MPGNRYLLNTYPVTVLKDTCMDIIRSAEMEDVINASFKPPTVMAKE